MKRAIVITTIHGVTEAVSRFLDFRNWDVIVVGDKKTPEIDEVNHENLTYLSISDQKRMEGELDKLPYNHYSRKNLGYQFAIQEGASVVADTDDDNLPKEGWTSWGPNFDSAELLVGEKYTNVYEHFTDSFVWPRGYPLDQISKKSQEELIDEAVPRDSIAVFQGLADVEPDIDAIHRLIFDSEVQFESRPPIVLDSGTYSPFNSQNTLWPSKDAYPYLYLPTTVSFRFTDILRSYVAQRGIWALGKHIAFTDASVYQDRNVHDLMKDFESEVPCYLETKDVVSAIDSLQLRGKPKEDIRSMYEKLEDLEIVEPQELTDLNRWLSAI